MSDPNPQGFPSVNIPLTPPHQEPGDKEEVYYEGSPLLRGNVGRMFGYCLFGIVLIAVPIVAAMGKWSWWPGFWLTAVFLIGGGILLAAPILFAKTIRYRITNYRIDYERGVFTKRIDTLELWHVEDISFEQSLIDRILGVGNILIVSHDTTTPRLLLHGLPHPRPVFDALKERIIAVKRQRGVVKMDTGT
ncbi:MAG TPA: PH domain-containing protein [Tepidisphaeraceae bacterium]|jgi:hypothetical protein